MEAVDSKSPFVTQEETSSSDKPTNRIQWANDREFFLACLGYCVGLGNVWRFSYLCYENGGGAFLIPYTLVAVLVGMPMYFLEVAIGQFMKRGPIGTYNLIPVMKGVGVGSVIVCFYFSLYYIVILAWGLMYFFHSFTIGDLPWSTCGNWWNTNSCISYTELLGGINTTHTNITTLLGAKNSSNAVLSIEEFWKNYIIRQSSGIGDIGSTDNYLLQLCFLAAWCLCYFCIFKGVKSTGKVVYFTATFPYIILTVLVVRGCTLEGAGEGIKYYLYPNFTKLADSSVWMQAGSQVLFSYGVGFCVLMAFGSYNDFHTDCFKHVALLTSTCSITSIYAGFSVFGVLGHLAHMTNKNVSDVVASGPGLAFQTYPTAISLMPFPQIWAILFFFMIIIIGIDSEFTCLEGIVCAISDVYPRIFHKKRSREYLTLAVCVFLALLGLPLTFGCGIYIFELINNYAVGGTSLFPLVICEVLSFSYIYGINRLYEDFKSMLGYYPTSFFKVCFMAIVPILSSGILIFSLFQYEPLSMGKYNFPVWANVLGWMMAMSSVLMIPIFFVWKLATANGSTLTEKWKDVTTPRYSDHIQDKMKSYSTKEKSFFVSNI